MKLPFKMISCLIIILFLFACQPPPEKVKWESMDKEISGNIRTKTFEHNMWYKLDDRANEFLSKLPVGTVILKIEDRNRGRVIIYKLPEGYKEIK